MGNLMPLPYVKETLINLFYVILPYVIVKEKQYPALNIYLPNAPESFR